MPFTNRFLVRWANGYTYRDDGASVAANGAREGFLALADVRSTDEVDRVTLGLLARHAAEQVATRLTVEPITGKTPFVDYGIGDTVSITPDITGTTFASNVRVTGMLVTEDEEGNPAYAPELGTQILDPVERMNRALTRMALGSFGGRSETVTPIIGDKAELASSAGFTDEMVFSLAGAVTVSESPRWHPPATLALAGYSASLGTAGTTTTTIVVKVNGATVHTIFLTSGEALETGDITAVRVGVADYVQVGVTGVGTSAADLTVQLRFRQRL